MASGQKALGLKRAAIGAVAAVLMLMIGFLAGFFTAKQIGTANMLRSYHGAQTTANSQAVPPLQFKRGTPVDGYNLRQLPPPWSKDAQRFQASRSTEGDLLPMELYTYESDALIITEELTGAFLEQMQQQLEANGYGAHTQANMTEVLGVFRAVARDVLSYLRRHRSQALLPLLRQFSKQGTVTLADTNPDILRQEVQDLLKIAQLSLWYAEAARFDHPSITTIPPNWSQPQGATEQLLTDSADPGATAAAGSSPSSSSSSSPSSSGRRLTVDEHHQAALAGWSRQLNAKPEHIPVIPSDEALKDAVPPTYSPLMTVQDMLCSVRTFSPTGLEGMRLPGNTTGQAIKCKPAPKPSIFRYNNLVFKRVRIPVVFHCQRFLSGNIVMPPLWNAEDSGRNLIAVTNKLFSNTMIEFTLLEVRHDVEKYPYLLLNTLKDWQDCTGNPSQEAAGFPCLQETARFPEVSVLAKRYVLNVLVGGSSSSMFCNRTEQEACTDLYSGYTGSIGPWFSRPSPTWSEDKIDENWVTISWDMFSPMIRNAYRFWDGGAVTLAHEIGHYLGLMHTHEGSHPCEGDGLDKADSVPDTPVNLQTVQWAVDKGLAVQLARWCTEFRTGKKPQPKKLMPFNSCKLDNMTIDNVFNLLSYLPDQCCMLLTPNQVARLQWAIAKFRPKMMAKYAV